MIQDKESSEISNPLNNNEDQQDFIKKNIENNNRFSIIYKKVFEGLKTETLETKQATLIAVKYISKGTITKEEEHELREQVFDLLKALGIGIPFALIPGASILIPVLIKIAQKKGINLLPSAFSENDNSEENDLTKE